MEASVSEPASVVAPAAAEKLGNSGHVGVPAALAPAAIETPAVAGAPRLSVGVKKKRGRPRKYRPDGSLLRPLNPIPISASAPARSFYVSSAPAMKRGRGRPVEFVSVPHHRIELEPSGLMVACSAGANFTPHIINVAAGEDVTMKIISFSQQGPRSTCILSANGVISNATLRQPDSSGGTLTYEGRFELLSLSGSFMPNENEGTKARSGGMSVSLASQDGRVVGGGVAGLLVAAGPVQVVVGSFLPSYQMEQKTKRSKSETVSLSVSIPAAAIPVSGIETDEVYGGGYLSSTAAKSTTPTTSAFRVENWSSCSHSAPDNKKHDDAKVSLR